jgi:hypothetical protein
MVSFPKKQKKKIDKELFLIYTPLFAYILSIAVFRIAVTID